MINEEELIAAKLFVEELNELHKKYRCYLNTTDFWLEIEFFSKTDDKIILSEPMKKYHHYTYITTEWINEKRNEND